MASNKSISRDFPSQKCTTKAKSTGKRCKKDALRGSDKCLSHGGGSAKNRIKAKAVVAEKMMNNVLATRGWEPLTDPMSALGDLAGEVMSFKELCRTKLAELNDSDWLTENEYGAETAGALVMLYERSLDRTTKLLVDMSKLGIDAATLRVARERPSREMAETLFAVLDGVVSGLDLTDEQKTSVPSLMREAFEKEGLI